MVLHVSILGFHFIPINGLCSIFTFCEMAMGKPCFPIQIPTKVFKIFSCALNSDSNGHIGKQLR